MTKTRRVAVAIDLGYPFRHHYDFVAGIECYAGEHGGWECLVDPYVDLDKKDHTGAGYDGVIGRISGRLAQDAAKAGLPINLTWSGSPAKTLPCVLPDFRAAAAMAAEHLLMRGYRHFALHGFTRQRGTEEALADSWLRCKRR